ncbi:MAG: hypothetical protein, partial [Olavius algarvensis Gamma 3 endosymbiont]
CILYAKPCSIRCACAVTRHAPRPVMSMPSVCCPGT